MIYVPPSGAAAAIDEAVDAELDLVVCITEGIPVLDMLEDALQDAGQKDAAARAELPRPDHAGRNQDRHHARHIHKKGRIGVVSRSGTLTYEAVGQLTELGLGQSSAVGIGGDPINGLKHIDVMRMFNDDPETDAVIMIGEIGGPDEGGRRALVKANMKKPVVGFIAGVTAPRQAHGHAGALISGGADTRRRQTRHHGRVRLQDHPQSGGDGQTVVEESCCPSVILPQKGPRCVFCCTAPLIGSNWPLRLDRAILSLTNNSRQQVSPRK